MKLIRKLARLFITREPQEGSTLKFNLILVDNPDTHFQHLTSCINDLRSSLNNLDITLVTTTERSEFIRKFVKDIYIIESQRRYIPKRWRLAFELILLGGGKFNYVVLLSTNIPLIFTTFLFLRKQVYFYSPRHRWTMIRRKTLDEVLCFLPRLILNFFVFIYLVFSAIFIFLRRPVIIRRQA